MAQDLSDTQLETVGTEVRKNWGWLLFGGILLTVFGFMGLYMVAPMTLVSVLYFGFMVVAGGVVVLIDAFQAEGWKAKLWQILLAVLYIVSGIIMIMNPGASAVWFTLFIAGFLLVSGIFRIITGFTVRGEVKGWGWTVAGGVASMILAFMIAAQWPFSGLWVIGMFVAIEMIMQGTSMITVGFAAKAAKDAQA